MQMAIDRTATYQSANIGYTRQLTDKLQINLDFTQAHINGTIDSFTVAGMLTAETNSTSARS